MIPAPQTKSEQLISELNQLIADSRINELALARLEREAVKIKNTDKLGFLMVKGVIASLRGDEEGLYHYHISAIEQASGKFKEMAVFNYANSLRGSGNFSEALKYSLLAYEMRHDQNSLRLAIKCARDFGLNSRVHSLLAEWERLTGEEYEYVEKVEPNGVMREEVMELLEKDIREHAQLWAGLAKI